MQGIIWDISKWSVVWYNASNNHAHLHINDRLMLRVDSTQLTALRSMAKCLITASTISSFVSLFISIWGVAHVLGRSWERTRRWWWRRLRQKLLMGDISRFFIYLIQSNHQWNQVKLHTKINHRPSVALSKLHTVIAINCEMSDCAWIINIHFVFLYFLRCAPCSLPIIRMTTSTTTEVFDKRIFAHLIQSGQQSYRVSLNFSIQPGLIITVSPISTWTASILFGQRGIIMIVPFQLSCCLSVFRFMASSCNPSLKAAQTTKSVHSLLGYP